MTKPFVRMVKRPEIIMEPHEIMTKPFARMVKRHEIFMERFEIMAERHEITTKQQNKMKINKIIKGGKK